MSSYQRKFANEAVLSWTIDTWEEFYERLKEESSGFDVNNYLDSYKSSSFLGKIEALFTDAPFKLNLGGTSEKSKLVTTDKPNGVFDFSLASSGLYKLTEYYSEKLFKEQPNKFDDFELPSGVVPNNLVQEAYVDGEKIFYYMDNGIRYPCKIQQKGTAAVEQNIQGARKQFATRNRKVYLTYKRNKGKVKYVEIYSLFYYTSLDNDLEFAVRHIPAMMVADYLESIGVMTRFYMTRFVLLSNSAKLKAKTKNGIRLPMYDEFNQLTNPMETDKLFVQPIIAKDFGEEFDKSRGLMTSSNDYSNVYQLLAKNALSQELTKEVSVIGQPNHQQIDYHEGFERYRNKYKQYVDLGIFKSKEVLPEAMVFFHDMVIKQRFSNFMKDMRRFFPSKQNYETLLDINVNHFFNWWMRLSANNLRFKIEIINSRELRKDLATIEKKLEDLVFELTTIINDTDANIKDNNKNTLIDYFKRVGKELLEPTDEYDGEYGYDMIDKNGNLTFVNYIQKITTELTTYAEGGLYETDKETQIKRDALLTTVLEELQNFAQ